MSWFFTSGGQSIGASASASVLSMNIQGRFPLGWTGDWIGLLAVQGTLKSLLQHHSSKASIPRCSAFFMVQLSHLCMTTEKTIALTIRPLSAKLEPTWNCYLTFLTLLGAEGNSSVPSQSDRVLMRSITFKMNIQELLTAPKDLKAPGSQLTHPHQGKPGSNTQPSR